MAKLITPQEISDLESELRFLGLLDKAREIYSELGEQAVLSYIKSSYRLLSKVYHPDLNPANKDKASMNQVRLNRLGDLISSTQDRELIELIGKGVSKRKKNKKKILVLEDEPGLRNLFRDIFIMEGYDVRSAADGDEGYGAYAAFEPDLIFADVVMPKMNGLEAVKQIRNLNPGIRVIYISGFFGIEDIKHEIDREVEKYGYRTISKPFKLSELLELVKDYLAETATDSKHVSLYT